MKLRSPIAVVLGHIDHGKTALLDAIRGTGVQLREAGGITQHIGASFLPTEVIEDLAEELVEKFNIKLTIPGILVLDTPGHEAFFNLRARGGAVADFAVLVVDVVRGFQTQTYECINLLRSRRVPFLVAANKIDLIPGWRPSGSRSFLKAIDLQEDYVRRMLDERIYELMGELSGAGFNSERFDRVRDFTKTVAIVPTSAKTGEGVAELLVVLAGLAQQYLKKRLTVSEGEAKGVVLEVKEETGLGTTIDVILYDGVLRRNDLLVTGGLNGAVTTRIRALLQPKPLDEMRDPRERFISVEEVAAAAGVKIAAPNLDKVVAGAPLRGVRDPEQVEEVAKEVQREIESIMVRTDRVGVVIKADTLGSLEALVNFFKERGVAVRVADIGDVAKKDVLEAAAVAERDPLSAVILAFNVRILPDAEEEAEKFGVTVFYDKIIYKLFEKYNEWVLAMREEMRRQAMEGLVKPAKIRILPGYVFRRSKPAIVGVEVVSGEIRPRYRLMNREGKEVGEILQIQDKGEAKPYARQGEQVAISIRGPTVGRQIDEGDVLYTSMPLSHIDKFKFELREELTSDELEALREIEAIKRPSPLKL
ncbi:MAG: translation initiation factor IF-2 [Candidatus Freyarchaeota archaeon]